MYDIFRGIYTGRFHPRRNNVHLPFLLSVVMADVSKKTGSTISRPPYVDFFGGSDRGAEARRAGLAVNGQLHEANLFRKGTDFFMLSDLYGTAVCQYGWSHERQVMRYQKREVNPQTMAVARKIVVGEVVTRDQPDMEMLDSMSFFPEPGRVYTDQLRWAIRHQISDFDDVRALIEGGVFDEGTLSETINSGLPTRQEQQFGLLARIGSYDEADPLSRPVELLHYYGELPDELIPDGGTKRRLITIANRKVLLRNRDWPYESPQLPFLAHSPIPDPHQFWAMGKAESAYRMQLLADRFASQQADIVDRAADPMWLYDLDSQINPDHLISLPNHAIGVNANDKGLANTLMALSPDLRGLDRLYPTIQQLWGYMQLGTGIIEDAAIGVPTSKRQTRAEFTGRQAAVSTRLFLETRLAEVTWLEPLADAFKDLNRQFLTDVQEIRLSGMAGRVDPISGKEYPPQMFVDYQDFEPTYSVRARATSQMLSRESQQERLAMLAQFLGAIPQAAMRVNWENYLRALFSTVEEFAAQDLLNLSPEELALNMLAMTPGRGLPQPGTGGDGGEDNGDEVGAMATGTYG
jgi:hypothetical protein